MSGHHFATARLDSSRSEPAPDGSEVRPLLRLPGGSMAHFELPPGATSSAAAHRTVDEIWYVLSGRGELWRRHGEREETVDLEAGVCLTIPAGTQFQFRAAGNQALCILGLTMPPWPGDGEAVPVQGRWG